MVSERSCRRRTFWRTVIYKSITLDLTVARKLILYRCCVGRAACETARDGIKKCDNIYAHCSSDQSVRFPEYNLDREGEGWFWCLCLLEVLDGLEVPEVMLCVLLCLMEVLETPEAMRCVLLCMLEEPEVMRCVLLCMLEVLEMLEVMRCVLLCLMEEMLDVLEVMFCVLLSMLEEAEAMRWVNRAHQHVLASTPPDQLLRSQSLPLSSHQLQVCRESVSSLG